MIVMTAAHTLENGTLSRAGGPGAAAPGPTSIALGRIRTGNHSLAGSPSYLPHYDGPATVD